MTFSSSFFSIPRTPFPRNHFSTTLPPSWYPTHCQYSTSFNMNKSRLSSNRRHGKQTDVDFTTSGSLQSPPLRPHSAIKLPAQLRREGSLDLNSTGSPVLAEDGTVSPFVLNPSLPRYDQTPAHRQDHAWADNVTPNVSLQE